MPDTSRKIKVILKSYSGTNNGQIVAQTVNEIIDRLRLKQLKK